VSLPFESLPPGWFAVIGVAFLVVLAMVAWTVILFVRSQRARLDPPEASPEAVDRFEWVFLVPALNEEITIRDSVERLLRVEVSRRKVIVIDDGSDDRTPEILSGIDDPDLHVVRREPPNARRGKAAALNHAYRSLERLVEAEDRERTIVVVVDADGRLDPASPAYVAPHFDDPAVGGLQSLVRIYNRGRLLTWMQDVEFSVYGCLYQMGRTRSGTAGMGGNGQFNRLLALDSISDADGPWRDKLTEDQDLGLRLIAAGWEGRQDLRAVVDQQGPPGLRALFRQRTRWSQGNLQAMGLLRTILGAPVSLLARLDLVAYLLMPVWQGIVGIGLAAGVFLALTDVAPFWDTGDWELALFFYVLGFGATTMGCVAAEMRDDGRGALFGLLIAQAYAFYSWLLWPVLLRSAFRQLTVRRSWAKSERVELASGGSTI
jgi:hypothetical protein